MVKEIKIIPLDFARLEELKRTGHFFNYIGNDLRDVNPSQTICFRESKDGLEMHVGSSSAQLIDLDLSKPRPAQPTAQQVEAKINALPSGAIPASKYQDLIAERNYGLISTSGDVLRATYMPEGSVVDTPDRNTTGEGSFGYWQNNNMGMVIQLPVNVKTIKFNLGLVQPAEYAWAAMKFLYALRPGQNTISKTRAKKQSEEYHRWREQLLQSGNEPIR